MDRDLLRKAQNRAGMILQYGRGEVDHEIDLLLKSLESMIFPADNPTNPQPKEVVKSKYEELTKKLVEIEDDL